MRAVSSSDWERAIYIDFEGRVSDPPTFLGMCTGERWSAKIIEPLLWSAEKYGHPKGEILSTTPLNAYELIREAATRERRMIVAWSTREIDAILKTPGLTARESDWWTKNLVDGKKHAKRMARELSISIAPRKSKMGPGQNKASLASFMEATEYEVPSIHGPGNTAQRILYVRNQVNRKGDFSAISSAAKTKWTNLLSHNYHDCVGLRHVMITLSRLFERRT